MNKNNTFLVLSGVLLTITEKSFAITPTDGAPPVVLKVDGAPLEGATDLRKRHEERHAPGSTKKLLVSFLLQYQKQRLLLLISYLPIVAFLKNAVTLQARLKLSVYIYHHQYLLQTQR